MFDYQFGMQGLSKYPYRVTLIWCDRKQGVDGLKISDIVLTYFILSSTTKVNHYFNSYFNTIRLNSNMATRQSSACSLFHQHFTGSVFVNIHTCYDKLQIQTVSTEKMCKNTFVKKSCS